MDIYELLNYIDIDIDEDLLYVEEFSELEKKKVKKELKKLIRKSRSK